MNLSIAAGLLAAGDPNEPEGIFDSWGSFATLLIILGVLWLIISASSSGDKS